VSVDEFYELGGWAFQGGELEVVVFEGVSVELFYVVFVG